MAWAPTGLVAEEEAQGDGAVLAHLEENAVDATAELHREARLVHARRVVGIIRGNLHAVHPHSEGARSAQAERHPSRRRLIEEGQRIGHHGTVRAQRCGQVDAAVESGQRQGSPACGLPLGGVGRLEVESCLRTEVGVTTGLPLVVKAAEHVHRLDEAQCLGLGTGGVHPSRLARRLEQKQPGAGAGESVCLRAARHLLKGAVDLTLLPQVLAQLVQLQQRGRPGGRGGRGQGPCRALGYGPLHGVGRRWVCCEQRDEKGE